ncbi:MAG: ABC transporter substrate-binding protein [Deltaproteobacteria bacterium]|nr:MAG: ABC transporter substrate-binding protein [Deltaproteobacteria bacterium]
MEITIAHSPDADDASMFYPIFQGKVDTQGIQFSEIRQDIETLNKMALEGKYDVSAISFHAYPAISEHYRMMTTGACFGEKYGPIIVASKPLKAKQLLKVRMAIPGKKTTAFLVLKLYEQFLAGEGKPGLCYSELPFDQVMEAVEQGKADAGLIIHEGQLSYQDKGLFKIVDLGEWWDKQFKLPLPLGAIAIKRSLDEDLQKKIYEVIQASIRYSVANPEESLKHSIDWARGLDAERTTKFISMYVNDLTIDCGKNGIKAIKTLFERAYRAGLISKPVNINKAFLNPTSKPLLSEVSEIVPEVESI